VLEGIAFEQDIATAAMESALGRRDDRMIAAGGGTNSLLLMQIMASVLERPISVSPVNEAAALGAAMLGASGVGWYPSPPAACRAMAAPATRRINPTEAMVADYRLRKPIYRDLYQATRDIHRRLDEITAR
jgi:xylulokinase